MQLPQTAQSRTTILLEALDMILSNSVYPYLHYRETQCGCQYSFHECIYGASTEIRKKNATIAKNKSKQNHTWMVQCKHSSD